MPSTHSLPHRPTRAAPRSLRAATPGALMAALAGAIAGLLIGGTVEALLFALAAALLVLALVATLPDHRVHGAGDDPATARRHRRAPPRPPHPAAEPTATLAVPPPGPDAPPGWYPDPDPAAGAEDVKRLWDGEAWTEHRWAPRA